MHKAFTLVELLITIGIIAVLLAILVPVLLKARGNAQKSTCVSNLRTLGQSVRLYVDDNDGTWPNSTQWTDWNVPHRFEGCPQAPTPERTDYRYDHVLGYAYNSKIAMGTVEFLPGDLRISSVTDKQIAFPATTVAFCDASNEYRVTLGPDPNRGQLPYPQAAEKGWERHNGGGHYLFCDGHIKWYRAGSVMPAYPSTNDGTRPSFALRTEPTIASK